ncbi:hypothetical protein GTW30_08375 [Streptomyces sp. SID7810]|nr:hypothetical protein [Streptomyces sp. SID7810]
MGMLLVWAADGRRRQLVSNCYRRVAPGVPVPRPARRTAMPTPGRAAAADTSPARGPTGCRRGPAPGRSAGRTP